MREAIKLVLGSSVVYAVMAACSAGSSTQSRFTPDTQHPSGDAAASSSGAGSSASGGNIDSGDIMDALTNPVPPAMANPTSGSRLKNQYWTSADGAKQPVPGFYDTQLKMTCNPGTASDGTTRCLPAMAVTEFFSDPSCTQLLASVSCNTAAPVPKYAAQYMSSTTCASPQVTYYQIGSQFMGQLYSGTATTCNKSLMTSDYSASGLTFYSLGNEVPASTFAAITVQTDP